MRIIILVCIFFSNTATSQFIYKNRFKSKIVKEYIVKDATKNYGNTVFLFGGGNDEAIAVAEFLHGFIGKEKKLGRLAFGGAVAKATQNSTGDLKALLQGGGNFFLTHSSDFAGGENEDVGFFMFIWRGKLGAVLPALGTTSNSIQAHFDPGVEGHFDIFALQGEEKVIDIVGSFRLGSLWTSKPYSENLKLTTNFLPYLYLTGGIRLKQTVQIVYSHQFFDKSKTTAPVPAASIGLSVIL